jgi:hypothetical protein
VGTIRRNRGLALLVVLPMALLVVLRVVPTLDRQFFDARMHLVAVGGIAACALVTALVASVAAARSSHPGAVWLGSGCAAVGVFMLGHGVMTPGQFGRGYSEWVVRFPHLAMAMFALALVAASRPTTNPVNARIGRAPGVAM